MRELSSAWTFFYKVIFPTLWIGGFALATLFMFVAPDAFHSRSGQEDIRGARWIFAAATLLGGALIYWACIRLKKVSLVAGRLVISNYRRAIEIPIRDVESVSGSILVSPELIWLRFRRPTEFGSKIMFMPKLRITAGFTRHPLVEELRSLISDAATHA